MPKCIDMCNKLLDIASSTLLKERIQKNLDIFKENLAFTVCHFCKKTPSNESSALSVPMHGDVNTKYVFLQGTRKTWSYLTVNVPRCAGCEKKHALRQGVCVGISVAVSIITGLVCLSIYGEDGICSAISLGAIAFGISFGITWLVTDSIILDEHGIKPVSYKSEFIQVKQLRKRGWSFGERPSGTG